MLGEKPNSIKVSNEPDNILVYLPASEALARKTMLAEGARAGFFEFFERAVCGSADAQAVIGLLYLIGWIDGQPQFEEARYWSQRSAQQDCAYGMWVNAWDNLETENLWEGSQQMMLAAESGFPPAICNLGSFCYNGIFLPQSASLGLQLFRQAAKMGNHTAKTMIMVLYRSGQHGLVAKLFGSTVLTAKLSICNFFQRLRRAAYDIDGLVYARSLAIENMLRRKRFGEKIESTYEIRLAQLIPSTKI